MKPGISILVCVYNSSNVIRPCLDSILSQDYRNFEVICIEGGSTDDSVAIVKEYMAKDKRVRMVINKNKLPEGKGNGKWLGFMEAKGDIVGIIDHDNVLQRRDLFRKIGEIFAKKKNISGVLGGLKHDSSDEKVVRFVALFGTDSFFSYRSIDFLRNFQDFKKIEVGGEEFETKKLKSDNLYLTGGNCFFYSKKSVEEVGGYDQDVLIINRLVKASKDELIIMNEATKHYAESDIYRLIKKKFSWGKSFAERKHIEKFSYIPKTKIERNAFLRNLAFNLLLVPNFVYSIKLFFRKYDPVVFLFPVLAFSNTLAYTLAFMKYN